MMASEHTDEMPTFNIEAETASMLNDLSDEELLAYAKLHEDPVDDKQIEQYIYACFLSFTRTRSAEALDQAILWTEGWIEATAPDHQDRARRVRILDMMVATKYQHAHILDSRLHQQSSRFIYPRRTQSEQVQAVGEPDEAIQAAEIGLLATSPSDAGTAELLMKRMISFDEQFDRTSDLADLNKAIDLADTAFNILYPVHPPQAHLLGYLGSLLNRRYERTKQMEDLNRAIEATQMAVDTSVQATQVPALYSLLGNLYGKRFLRTETMKDLNRAVEITRMMADATPLEDKSRIHNLNDCGIWLRTRFECKGVIEDINQAIDMAKAAVDATPTDHRELSSIFGNLGSALFLRAKWVGSMADLEGAIEATQIAVDASHLDQSGRGAFLSNLASMLAHRFEQTGTMKDIEDAVKYAEEAISVTGNDQAAQGNHLMNLGVILGERFVQLGQKQDIEQALEKARMAVEVMANVPDNLNRAKSLASLGTLFGDRFRWIGATEDLDAAIDALQAAVDAIPPDHTDLAGSLNNLGNLLARRFERTKEETDLDRAIELLDRAAHATPLNHAECGTRMSNLGAWLGKRFEFSRAIKDINWAIEVAETAVNVTTSKTPNRARLLTNLGVLLHDRFKFSEKEEDINRAVMFAEMAVDAVPPDHAQRAGWLQNLGHRLKGRFEWAGLIDDLQRALSSYKESWNCRHAPPSIRIRSAMHAADILTSQLDWEESSQLLQGAVNLLPVVCPRSLRHTDQQDMLAGFVGLASRAAATALNAGKGAYEALALLELGRDVISGLLMEMRGDLSDLKQEHPDLADEFTALRDKLDRPVDMTMLSLPTGGGRSWESQIGRRLEADQKFDDLILKIRAQPNFGNFLLPPTAEELMKAASPDPIVVINSSPYRCDAFLINCDRIRVLELPRLTLEQILVRTRELQVYRLMASNYMISLLEWLWDVLARPVLDTMGFMDVASDGNWPRLWWIPTGRLNQLPLHAAGRSHGDGFAESVLDRVMSSYSSSIKALLHGRRHHLRHSTGSPSDSALLVAMDDTPDLSANQNLLYASDEVEMLKDLCPSLQLKPVLPTRRKVDILQHLSKCKIFHFAGHGQSNPMDPSKGCLLLEDWKASPLTVGDVRNHWLQDSSPFLAYLSACSTGANMTEELTDEGIHLVSAFQLAGFRHVIGTLWEVSDRHCVHVARVLYDTIRDEGMTDLAICRGLHRAIRAVRDGQIGGRQQASNITLSKPNMQARTSDLSDGQGATNTSREDRDPIGVPRVMTRSTRNFFWVPYIHFGI